MSASSSSTSHSSAAPSTVLWHPVPGRLQSVCVADKDHIWGVTLDLQLCRLNPETQQWQLVSVMSESANQSRFSSSSAHSALTVSSTSSASATSKAQRTLSAILPFSKNPSASSPLTNNPNQESLGANNDSEDQSEMTLQVSAAADGTVVRLDNTLKAWYLIAPHHQVDFEKDVIWIDLGHFWKCVSVASVSQIWGLSDCGDIYYGTSDRFVQLESSVTSGAGYDLPVFTHISVGHDNVVLATDSHTGTVFRLKTHPTASHPPIWTALPGTGRGSKHQSTLASELALSSSTSATQGLHMVQCILSTADYVVGVTKDGHVYRFLNGHWINMGGGARLENVGVGLDGYVLGVDRDGDLFGCQLESSITIPRRGSSKVYQPTRSKRVETVDPYGIPGSPPLAPSSSAGSAARKPMASPRELFEMASTEKGLASIRTKNLPPSSTYAGSGSSPTSRIERASFSPSASRMQSFSGRYSLARSESQLSKRSYASDLALSNPGTPTGLNITQKTSPQKKTGRSRSGSPTRILDSPLPVSTALSTSLPSSSSPMAQPLRIQTRPSSGSLLNQGPESAGDSYFNAKTLPSPNNLGSANSSNGSGNYPIAGNPYAAHASNRVSPNSDMTLPMSASASSTVPLAQHSHSPQTHSPQEGESAESLPELIPYSATGSLTGSKEGSLLNYSNSNSTTRSQRVEKVTEEVEDGKGNQSTGLDHYVGSKQEFAASDDSLDLSAAQRIHEHALARRKLVGDESEGDHGLVTGQNGVGVGGGEMKNVESFSTSTQGLPRVETVFPPPPPPPSAAAAAAPTTTTQQQSESWATRGIDIVGKNMALVNEQEDENHTVNTPVEQRQFMIHSVQSQPNAHHHDDGLGKSEWYSHQGSVDSLVDPSIKTTDNGQGKVVDSLQGYGARVGGRGSAIAAYGAQDKEEVEEDDEHKRAWFLAHGSGEQLLQDHPPLQVERVQIDQQRFTGSSLPSLSDPRTSYSTYSSSAVDSPRPQYQQQYYPQASYQQQCQQPISSLYGYHQGSDLKQEIELDFQPPYQNTFNQPFSYTGYDPQQQQQRQGHLGQQGYQDQDPSTITSSSSLDDRRPSDSSEVLMQQQQHFLKLARLRSQNSVYSPTTADHTANPYLNCSNSNDQKNDNPASFASFAAANPDLVQRYQDQTQPSVTAPSQQPTFSSFPPPTSSQPPLVLPVQDPVTLPKQHSLPPLPPAIDNESYNQLQDLAQQQYQDFLRSQQQQQPLPPPQQQQEIPMGLFRRSNASSSAAAAAASASKQEIPDEDTPGRPSYSSSHLQNYLDTTLGSSTAVNVHPTVGSSSNGNGHGNNSLGMVSLNNVGRSNTARGMGGIQGEDAQGRWMGQTTNRNDRVQQFDPEHAKSKCCTIL